MQKLGLKEIHDNMEQLAEWELIGHEITRTFHFENFDDAMKFVNAVADVSKKIDHHPEIYIKKEKITITLTTHDLQALTDKDFEVAKAVNQIQV